MSDEEIIKKRLLIDGDGTGDDRRLNTLFKQFLKWTYSKNDSPENNQIIYDRLLAQLAQCEFAAAKSERIIKMHEEELQNYAKISKSIDESIELAKQEIDDCKKELVVAKQIRKNKMEYDNLARLIKEQPDRVEVTKQIETTKKELAELLLKRNKLEQKIEKRRKDFRLLMCTIRELEASLEDESSSEDGPKDDPEDTLGAVGGSLVELSDDDEQPSTSKSIIKTTLDLQNLPTIEDIEKELIEEAKRENLTLTQLTQKRMSTDEDPVLELSIDKDDDVKMEKTPPAST